VLEPPVAIINAVDGMFEFQATSANNEPEFLGFEVYYRIYKTTDSVATYFNSFQDMVDGGFQRLYNSQWAPGATGFTKPLMAPAVVDHGTDYQITIDFNVDATLYPQVSSSGLSTEITIQAARRSVAASDRSEYKRFRVSYFASGDADITTELWQIITNDKTAVTIVMFAVSYGLDTDKIIYVYSLPVWLGQESLTIPD
jgi:hypothetical protein